MVDVVGLDLQVVDPVYTGLAGDRDDLGLAGLPTTIPAAFVNQFASKREAASRQTDLHSLASHPSPQPIGWVPFDRCSYSPNQL